MPGSHFGADSHYGVEYRVFCFADRTHADLFRERFGGERNEADKAGQGPQQRTLEQLLFDLTRTRRKNWYRKTVLESENV